MFAFMKLMLSKFIGMNKKLIFYVNKVCSQMLGQLQTDIFQNILINKNQISDGLLLQQYQIMPGIRFRGNHIS